MSSTTAPLPHAGVEPVAAERAGTLRNWLTPSLCDMFLLAVIAAAGVWFIYRREMKRREDSMKWLLPTLRAVAGA